MPDDAHITVLSSRREYMKEQMKEMLGPDNKNYWSSFSGRHGDTASNNELAEHYITNGGAKHFRDTHVIEQGE